MLTAPVAGFHLRMLPGVVSGESPIKILLPSVAKPPGKKLNCGFSEVALQGEVALHAARATPWGSGIIGYSKATDLSQVQIIVQKQQRVHTFAVTGVSDFDDRRRDVVIPVAFGIFIMSPDFK